LGRFKSERERGRGKREREREGKKERKRGRVSERHTHTHIHTHTPTCLKDEEAQGFVADVLAEGQLNRGERLAVVGKGNQPDVRDMHAVA
jgi:hypothetical protein